MHCVIGKPLVLDFVLESKKPDGDYVSGFGTSEGFERLNSNGNCSLVSSYTRQASRGLLLGALEVTPKQPKRPEMGLVPYN